MKNQADNDKLEYYNYKMHKIKNFNEILNNCFLKNFQYIKNEIKIMLQQYIVSKTVYTRLAI